MKKISIAAGLLLGGTAAVAQPEGQPDFIGVAKVVAEQEGISVGEAVRRIKMQERIFRLQEKLFKQDPDSFGGIEIVSDKRQQRVRIKYKKAGTRQAATLVEDTEIRAESDLVDANFSIRELMGAQAALLDAADGFNAPLAVGLNFATNGLNVKTPNPAALQAHLTKKVFTTAVPLNYVVGDPTIINEARITGGRDVEGCQTGFVVANYSGGRGVSSAEHCGRTLIDLQTGVSVGTWQNGLERNGEGYDINWFTGAGHTYVNSIFTPNGEVRITSSMGTSLMPYNTRACLSRTQYNPSLGSPTVSCGIVYNANYTFRDPSTGLTTGPWVAVSPQGGTVLSQPGDSGGPWFNGGNAAMGIHKGKDPTGYSLFTPAERLSKISVYIATN